MSDREIDLLDRITKLESALRTTLDYQAELQPNVPSNIAAFYQLIADPKPTAVSFDTMGGFLDSVTSMARFLSNTAGMAVFSRSGTTGFVDWIILSTVASQPRGSFTDRQLTRFMGASFKRIRRLLNRLADTGMVSLSAPKDADVIGIEVTPAGQAAIETINAELEPLLKFFVKRDPLRLPALVTQISFLSRLHDRASRRERIDHES